KLKPSIAHFLVRLFTKEGETVLDPFSGVGTIPFEACSQGRRGIGSDLAPIAFHATQAKVSPPALSSVRSQLEALSVYIEKEKDNVDISDAEEEIIPFYHDDTLREILAAKKFFKAVQTPTDSFVLTCLLHILHGNRPYALSRRSHNIMPWPPKGEFVYKSLMESLSEKANRTASHPLPIGFVKGNALSDNVTSLSLEDSSVDAILTSPPFYGSRDFLRMNRIRLWFSGWTYADQRKMKESFLEHQKDITSYRSVFAEFNRVLKPGGICVMHVGVVKTFNMAEKLTPLAQQAGFEMLSVVDEDTSDMESHGIRDRGATHTHQFLMLRNPDL
ncbi:MAG: DNA methylase, partial [Thermoplasmata archaeon]|nr:DNA methylase [Thermoplasmata archaeon]